MSRGRVVLPSLAAGVLVAASVPPNGVWESGIAGLGLLAWRLTGLRGRARLLAGLLFGIGLFGPTLVWATSFSVGGYVILVLLEAGFFGLACVMVPAGRGRILVFAAVVTLAEAARSAWPFGGFPMGGIPLGQASGPLLATARVGGPLLMTGLAALGGVCLALAAHLVAARSRGGGVDWRRRLAGRDRGSVPRTEERDPWYVRVSLLSSGRAVPIGLVRERADRLGVAAALSALLVVGAVAVSATLTPDGGPAVGSLRVALVQGGGARGLRAVDVNPRVTYTAQLRATAGVTRPVGLVLWPEDTVALYGPLAGSIQDSQVGALAGFFDATLVAGVTEDVGTSRFVNEAVAWGPSGTVIGSYEKVHRVPFGEYVPLRSILRHLVNLSAVPRDAIPGHGPGILKTPAGPLGVMISYEAFFSSSARAAVQAGGQVLIVPTNTSSYSSNLVPGEEEAADRMRSVEEGRDLVQASPTGYSTVVNSHGQVRDRSNLGVPAVVEATVAKRAGLTLYERGGDTPELVLAGLAVLVGWGLARAAAPG